MSPVMPTERTGCFCLTANYFFWGAIEGTARVVGVPIRLLKTGAECAEVLPQASSTTLLIDLHHPDAMAVCARCRHPSVRTIGFVSHMDTARIAAARSAGCQEVWPKSQFFTQLPTLLRA